MRNPLMLSLGAGVVLSLGLVAPALCGTSEASVWQGHNMRAAETISLQFSGARQPLIVAFDDVKEDAKESEKALKEDAQEAKKGVEGSPKDIKEDQKEADKDAKEDQKEEKKTGVSQDESKENEKLEDQ